MTQAKPLLLAGTLGGRIRARRLALKLTVAAVARACGWDSIRVSGYETGRHEPSDESLRLLARALRTSHKRLSEGAVRLKRPGRRAASGVVAAVQHRAPQSADARRRAQAERPAVAARATRGAA